MAKAQALAKEKKAEKRLHKFLDLWKSHVVHELKLHHHLKAGKKTLEHHIKQSIKIHEKLLKELKKL